MNKNSPEVITVESQDQETRCAGGRSFEECDTAQQLLRRNESYRMDPARATANGNYVHLLDDKMICKARACGYICHIALEIVELKPSGNARIICEPQDTKITTPL